MMSFLKRYISGFFTTNGFIFVLQEFMGSWRQKKTDHLEAFLTTLGILFLMECPLCGQAKYNKKTIFSVGIKNKGNVRITPRVTIEVTNIFGQSVVRLQDREIGVVFPRSENAEGAVIWEGMPIFGRYKVKMTTTFFEEGVGQKSQELVIWAVPYRIVFFLIFLFVVSMLLALIKKYFTSDFIILIS